MTVQTARLIAGLLAALVCWQQPVAAQCQPAWSGEFAMGDLDAPAHALAWFDDGSGPALYVAGAFTRASGLLVGRAARWDGEAWSALGVGLSGPVRAMVLHDDGSGPALFVAGEFLAAGGAAAPSRVAKWDGSGWTPLPGATDGVILDLEVFDDGTGAALYVGGDFALAGGVDAANIARWDGAAWSALGSGVSGAVRALEPFDDGGGPALFVGGDFDTAGGVAADRLAKWTGAGWEATPTPAHASAHEGIRALAVFDDGAGSALYAGGWFEGAAGDVGLARLGEGRWDVLPGVPRGVYVLGPMEVGGRLALGAAGSASIGAWTGAEWMDLGLYAPSEWSGRVHAILRAGGPGGAATYVAGAIASVGPAAVRQIARFDGAEWSSLTALGGMGGRWIDPYAPIVWALHTSGSRRYVGCTFLTAGPVAAQAVAVLDGATWAPLGAGFPGGNAIVMTLREVHLPFARGLVAGGLLGSEGALSFWDGAAWRSLGSFQLGVICASCYPYAAATAVFDDGRGPALYVAGSFDEPGRGIARWDGQWEELGAGLAGIFGSGLNSGRSLAVHDDGSGTAIYVGGYFSAAGSVPAPNIARWNGSGWSAVGEGLTFPVEALLEFEDAGGRVLIAAGGDGSRGEVWRWDGAAWARMGNVFNGRVLDLAVFDDGSGKALYAGGEFSRGLLRWQNGQWSEVAGGVGGRVHALAPVAYEGVWALLVGGRFSGVGIGIESHNIARLVGCATVCEADCDGDGQLTFFDFLCFQSEFTAMSRYADCDDSGGHDFFDFLCFQNAFAAGCP